MSQIQQPGVTAGVLYMRGIDVISKPVSFLNGKLTNEQLENSGLRELIETWHKVKDRRSLDFCWREILEYQIIKLDHAKVQAVLCLDQNNLLRKIEQANGRTWAWRPGFAKFIVEATTSRAYGPQLEDLLGIEQNFVRRRKYLRSLMSRDQTPFTLNILPDLGDGKQTFHKASQVNVDQSHEKHPLLRRSMSVDVRAAISYGVKSEPASPTFKYPKLSRPRLRSMASESTLPHIQKVPEVHVLEAGSRGLQVTFGCHDLREARYLHDQLCVLSPIMLAFTASTPVHRGHLSEFDIRLNPTSKSTGECRAGETCSLIRPWRSLYPTYLTANAPRSRITRSTTNKEVFQLLKMEGFDDAMALFCAQGFTYVSPHTTTNPPPLFSNITQSLNPHVHLDLPSPTDPNINFRVTILALETQLTSHTNAAMIFFIALLRFAILGFDLDFRLPPHMVAENTAKAHRQDSILVEKFWWRSVRWRANGFGFGSLDSEQPLTTDAEPALVSIDHIVNGDPSRPETVGLSGVLDAYLADVEDGNSDAGSVVENCAGTAAAARGSVSETMSASDWNGATIAKYLAFIRRRAKGTVMTDARFIREFVKKHPEFDEADGVLSSGVWYDLVKTIDELNEGLVGC